MIKRIPLTELPRVIKYASLLAFGKYEVLSNLLERESEIKLKSFFTIYMYFYANKTEECLLFFTEEFLNGRVKQKMFHDIYYTLTKKVHDKKLYKLLIESTKKIYKSNLLTSNDTKEVLHIWGKTAFDNKDLDELKECISEIKHKGFYKHPLLQWYVKYCEGDEKDNEVLTE